MSDEYLNLEIVKIEKKSNNDKIKDIVEKIKILQELWKNIKK